ncbi:hypothetical protein ATK78_4161 [Pedobacter metabolipauper]|uniref:Uncharacterized protein n=1 Tax=Pedobacter metabolipauper TaxID=425513 RepID=A0A4R6STE1_9SPHI|nr:hypothetical protein ATK78_4161 [Pedobacter metabolipauper]
MILRAQHAIGIHLYIGAGKPEIFNVHHTFGFTELAIWDSKSSRSYLVIRMYYRNNHFNLANRK